MFEVWIAGARNGTKVAIEAFDTAEEAAAFAVKMIGRIEVYEVGVWDWSK